MEKLILPDTGSVTTPEDGFHEKLKVQISNSLLLILFFINLANVFAYGVFQWIPSLFWDGLLSMVATLVFGTLHALGYRQITRHLVMVCSMGSLLNITYLYGETTGVHFYILALVVVIFLLFDSLYIILIYSLAALVLFVLVTAVFRYEAVLMHPGSGVLYFPNLFVSFLIFLFVLYHFRFETDRYQEIVESQNRDLSALSQKLMAQKDEAEVAGDLLKQKSSLLEGQNKSILDSLRLASMLQNETLPAEDELFQGLRGGMVIYKPKNIVSGDFYWARRSYEGLLLVVADCIGHGVPGGMMAVYASNLISQIVEEQGKTFPSDILEELDRRLRRRIKQDPSSDLGDGMDIAICLITETSLSFAAASRPLLRVRADGQTQVIAGTRFQLASWKTDQVSFETVEIDISPGDRFYLFTDGATDQLSGREGKRLGTRRLVHEISLLGKLPFSRQKTELESLIGSWQGSTGQTDDILLVGFEA